MSVEDQNGLARLLFQLKGDSRTRDRIVPHSTEPSLPCSPRDENDDDQNTRITSLICYSSGKVAEPHITPTSISSLRSSCKTSEEIGIKRGFPRYPLTSETVSDQVVKRQSQLVTHDDRKGASAIEFLNQSTVGSSSGSSHSLGTTRLLTDKEEELQKLPVRVASPSSLMFTPPPFQNASSDMSTTSRHKDGISLLETFAEEPVGEWDQKMKKNDDIECSAQNATHVTVNELTGKLLNAEDIDTENALYRFETKRKKRSWDPATWGKVAAIPVTAPPLEAARPPSRGTDPISVGEDGCREISKPLLVHKVHRDLADTAVANAQLDSSNISQNPNLSEFGLQVKKRSID